MVRRVDLTVRRGEVVCLLGPNGAGKTTTLLTIAGELAPVDGIVMFDNVPTFTPMYQRIRGGIGLVTEERLVFTKMSARDNLRIGGGSVERALALFPELEPRLSVRGGMLSGGEQQMLALARALSLDPKLLLADELSLGLAPKIVDRLLGAVRKAADDEGTGALIVEQHARKALKYADRMYLMARGQVLLELPADEAIERLDEIEEAYLRGTSETEEDHFEHKRRKDKKKVWRRLRVRERELSRLTGRTVSTRREQDDDYYLEIERQRRDRSMRARK
ncbi:ABC transporter ATP-binding protein [uncultured Ilumatobacter sp.]|uniref:ABC transporter ATP-binding protein n=1 Tax=Ilumatobacter sp. TaxID=1967498 RepID=UPI0030ABC50B